jgi:hypothetical protein
MVRKGLAEIKNELMTVMSSQVYAPTEDCQKTIAFTKPLDTSAALLYTIAMGNAYSSAPEMNVRYSLIAQDTGTYVYAFVKIAMQGAFEQTQNVELTRGKAGREIQEMSWVCT